MITCAACASNTSAVQTVYRDYLHDCRHDQSDAAAQHMLTTAAEPCPAVVDNLPENTDFDTIVTLGDITLVNRQNGYQIDIHPWLDVSSLDKVLLHIRYAIASRDADRFYDYLSPALQKIYTRDALPNKLPGDPDLNALYAALAASAPGDATCILQDTIANCMISGMTIKLQIIDYQWKLAHFE